LKNPVPPPGPDTDRFSRRIGELRAALLGKNPWQLAEFTGADFRPLEPDQGAFRLLLWERPVALTFPDLVARSAQTDEELSVMNLALLLYYFNSADGAPVSGEWMSFSELPDGRFYNQAFQGYTGDQLGRAFQNDLQSFEHAAQSLGGSRRAFGDVAYTLQVLPRVPVLVVYWQGDEDFPATFRILFDASANHYLPTDAYAILGSTLTRRLIAAKMEDTHADRH
jgi:hypothetical protein